MNRPFIHGINFEERLRTKLESLGCRIYYDQTYDHQYKLDFIVNGFRDVARLPEHIGLQLTANKDDVVKQREFLHIQKKSFVVPKAVYLEADPSADLEQGAATLVYAALLALVFNREYRPNNVFFHIRNEVAEDVLAKIETAEEESTGWRQLDIPVTFREKSVIRFGEDKPVAFDIKL